MHFKSATVNTAVQKPYGNIEAHSFPVHDVMTTALCCISVTLDTSSIRDMIPAIQSMSITQVIFYYRQLFSIVKFLAFPCCVYLPQLHNTTFSNSIICLPLKTKRGEQGIMQIFDTFRFTWF